MPVKMSKNAFGMHGQQVAETYLSENGYNIIARNYRVRTGEIDIIACHGKYIVFIEVKSRTQVYGGLPREAVTPAKQQKIIHTAMHYISANEEKLQEQDFRFDVTEVLKIDGKFYINHIEDAFSL
ncbi:MAG: YraN family protein [Defluviitaleaceae bacterium]|nr:YraN family protein [Defluviitaleaceae bacterium]